MTIRSHIDARALNDKLNLIDLCVENAPEGVHTEIKEMRQIIGDIADELLARMKTAGFPICNCDGIREIEAVIYGAVRATDMAAIATAEGFSEAMQGPAKDRVIAQSIRDRDFLRGLRQNAADDDLIAGPEMMLGDPEQEGR